MLAHMVYFRLHDNSPPAIGKLVADCKEYLTGYPGQVFFACGTLCKELDRDVNVRDFDVALQVVFQTKVDHDAYQEAARHEQFIAENKPNWANVRVFDSIVD